MKILIYAFDPFNGEKINSSYEVLKNLKNYQPPKNVNIKSLVLPTSFQKAGFLMLKEFRKYSPNLILGLGQKEGIDYLKVERVALNLADSKHPDNLNHAPQDEPINKEGPLAYLTSLPNKEIVEMLNSEKIKSKLSLSAGTFVCNYVLYTLLNYVSQKNLNCRVGFIHIPKIPLQTKKHELSMALNQSSQGIEKTVNFLIENYT